MGSIPHTESRQDKRVLTWVLSIAFVVALVMGPGPGVYLVNPDPTTTEPAATLMGMPIVYAWALFWYAVMAVIVLTAYFKLWQEEKPQDQDKPDAT